MNELEPDLILRIAAKGDGVTADGRFAPRAAPGDRLRADGTLEPGPHHQVPPCRHFGQCGGCQLQHIDDAALTRFVTDRVVNAAEGQGIAIGELVPTHLSPPRRRRRATLHAQLGGKRPVLGFREEGSHRIVDLAECHVLAPELWRFTRRSVPRGVALGMVTGMGSVNSATAVMALGRAYRYHPTVFLAPPWPEIFVEDDERRHDFATAKAEYERLAEAYRTLGYETTILPRIGIAERTDFVREALGE